MKAKSWCVYFGAGVIFVISLLVAHQFSQNEWAEILTATPIPIALLAVLYQIFRDNAAFERELIKQNENNDFILSATSHMAIISFDKHVAFAEKYVAEVHRSVSSLITTGATRNALDLACRLHLIRLEFTVWETDTVSNTLDEFEHALQKIGAQMDGLRDSPASDDRTTKLNEVQAIFNKVLGFENAPESSSDEIFWKKVIQRLRDLLGITQLTEIRQNYINSAHERSQPTGPGFLFELKLVCQFDPNRT